MTWSPCIKIDFVSRYEGYNIDLIEEISKILGFNYSIRIVADGAYGSYNSKTDTWYEDKEFDEFNWLIVVGKKKKEKNVAWMKKKHFQAKIYSGHEIIEWMI